MTLQASASSPADSGSGFTCVYLIRSVAWVAVNPFAQGATAAFRAVSHSWAFVPSYVPTATSVVAVPGSGLSTCRKEPRASLGTANSASAIGLHTGSSTAREVAGSMSTSGLSNPR